MRYRAQATGKVQIDPDERLALVTHTSARRPLKFGGEDDAVDLEVGGVVAGGGVPADGECLAGEHEWVGALDGGRGVVAGLPCAEQLPGVLDRGLDCPSRGVSLNYLSGTQARLGGDEGEVVTRFRFIPDKDDGDGCRVGDGIQQAGERVHGDGLGLAVAGDRGL